MKELQWDCTCGVRNADWPQVCNMGNLDMGRIVIGFLALVVKGFGAIAAGNTSRNEPQAEIEHPQ